MKKARPVKRPLDRWFARPTTVVAALLIAAVLVTALLRSLQFGPSGSSGRQVYTVSIRYFGVGAKGIERVITIPLENAVSRLSGIDRLRSISEYGKSILEVRLSSGVEANNFYLALRDAVNSLYATLPTAVERPVILGAARGQRPFFITTMSLEGANLEQTRNLADTLVKPALQQIDGVGDVEVGGGSRKEVHVIVDERRASELGLSPESIAGVLQQQYLLQPVGSLHTGQRDIPVVLEGRFASLQALADLPISLSGGRIVDLGQVATVRYGGRRVSSISRIDERQRITLFVKSTGSANLVALSESIRRELAKLSNRRLHFRIIYDLGAQIGRSLGSVLRSLAFAAAVVALFVGLALRPPRNAVVLALQLPFVVLGTAAVLSALRVGVGHFILAGFGVGIGLIVDPGIITVSAIASRGSRSLGESVGSLISPLVASAMTTVVVLVPLFFMGGTIPGLREVSLTLALMVLLSLVSAVLFLPSFAAGARTTPLRLNAPRKRKQGRATIAHQLARLTARIVLTGSRRAVPVLVISGAVFALGVCAALHMRLTLAAVADPRSVYASIQYRSGTTVAAIDRRTQRLTAGLEHLPGVRNVEAISRRGASDVTVTLDGTPEDAVRVRAVLLERGRGLQGGFVYLPSGSTGGGQSMQISIVGPDNSRLRGLARTTAAALNQEPWVDNVVLDFKAGAPTYVFRVSHNQLSYYGLTTADIARALRWNLFGPVALKWFEPSSRQIDLRVRSEPTTVRNLPAIERTRIIGTGGRVVALGVLGRFALTRPPDRIYRTDRQRAVYLTLHSPGSGTAQLLHELQGFLASRPLPSGYAFRIDKSVFEEIARIRTLALLLLAALVLIFMTLAIQTESLSSPLLVMSIVPFSLSVPLAVLWLRGSGLNIPVIVSMIIMSGIIVNNAILIVDMVLSRCARLDSFSPGEVVRSMHHAVRRRAKPLLLTAATAVLGVVPFLFGTPADSVLFRPLATIVALGTAASVLATFLVLPAVAGAAPVFVRPLPRVKR